MTAVESQPATVVEFAPQEGPQWDFLSNPADIVIYGGARGGGKTYGLLLDPLRNVQIPQFRGVIFRRTFPQIYQEGGPWDTSERIYPYAGATPGNNQWTFPSGATIAFHHLANDGDWQNWLGSQIPYIAFDQLETFTERQVFSMMACNRDPNGIVVPCIRASCNPEPDCWLSRFISWWWNPVTGYPIMERSGKIRWFVRIGDVLKWSDSRESLKKQYPHTEPKSVSFIPAFVQDNAILLKNDPSYLSSLLAQPLVEQERWLKGNWKIKPTAGSIFNRAWFANKIVKGLPVEFSNYEYGRFWDLAHTAEEEGKDPDWTCSVKIARQGIKVYVMGFTRWRRTSYETEQSVKATAQTDGVGCKQGMEQEPAAGKSYCAYYQRDVLSGFSFEAVPSLKNKVVRAGPFSSACQAGNVFLVEDSWNAEFIDHLEAFRGDEEKNDVPDAGSGCYNMLMNAGGANAANVDTGDPDRMRNRMRVDRRVMFG